MTPAVQTAMLRRLNLEFDVDTSPAQGLEGPELDAWIERADDELFKRLLADRQADKLLEDLRGDN